jgi:hypothetical protein
MLTFRNLRAWSYWTMREMLDPVKGQGLMLPPDQELLSDLTAPRWKMTLQGVQIEAKEDIVKRLGRSPDAGDAVVLSILVDLANNNPVQSGLVPVTDQKPYRPFSEQVSRNATIRLS